jgi:hypothetical protein
MTVAIIGNKDKPGLVDAVARLVVGVLQELKLVYVQESKS